MEDYSKVFKAKVVNKTIAGVIIFGVTVAAVKEKDFEQHSLEFIHQDQINNTIAATGAYGGLLIGGDWLESYQIL